jgi:LuxR family maltose regulon positive regulatory protein
VLRVFRVLAASHWLAGHPQEAFAWLDRLEEYAQRHGLDRLLAYSLGDRTALHLLIGEHGLAEDRLRQLDEVHSRHAAAGASALGEIDELAQRVHVRWLMAKRDDEAAAAKLAPLIEQCEARGRFRSVTQAQLQRAIVDARCGRAQAAADHVVAALQRGHRLGLLRTLVDAAPGAGKLISEVAKARSLDPVLSFYVEQLQATRAVPQRSGAVATAPRTTPPAESFNEREMDVLRLLAQAMPNKKIARALNLSPETVKWYLSRIYGKLQVSGRDEAVARVRDLDLSAKTAGTQGTKPTR